MGTNTARMIADEAPLATVVGYAALTEAVRVAGGQSALATAVGKKQGQVLDWLTSTGAPADICPAIEHTTNEQVKCEDLRPDLHWVRGDSEEILGYLTPVDNADPQYIRASLMVEVRKQFARTVEDPITWLPEGFLQGGTLSTTGGQFNSQNGVYVPRGTCFQEVAADAVRLMKGAGELLDAFVDTLPSDGSWCAWQLFELAGHAIRYLCEAGHFAKLDTQQTRLAYLRGILHRLEPEQRKEIEDFYKFGSLIDTPRLTDESAFIDFADEIDDSARANDHEHFYTHAYGITHGIESDELRDQLIAKHGFRTFDGTPFTGRAPELDALHAEVREILASGRGGGVQTAPEEQAQRGDGTKALKARSVIRHPDPIEAYGGCIKSWRPNPDATVEDCLNDASFMLDEASEIFNSCDEMPTLGSAGVRLVSLSRELVSAIHSKLMAHDRAQQASA